MLNTEYKHLLHLLEAFIKEQPPHIDSDADFAEIERLAALHTVTGILGFMTKQYPYLFPPEKQKQLIHTYLSGVVFFSQKAAAMYALIEQMNQIELPHLLFKGFIVKNYYPIPELRNFGDIDILIKPTDRKKSHELMLRLGYEAILMKDSTYCYTKAGEFYEIHTAICSDRISEKIDLREYFQSIWENTLSFENYSYTYTLTPEYHFIYLLAHIAKHASVLGAGIRMYMDIAVYLLHFQNSLNWEWIFKELKSIQLYDFAFVVLSAVNDWFHIDLDNAGLPFQIPSISKQFSDEFLDYTMLGGIFGEGVRTVGESMLSIRGTEKSPFSKTAILKKRLFPSSAELNSTYTYLQRFPFLLPAAWIQRIFQASKRKKHYVRELQTVLSLDKDYVKNMQKLYKNLGL